MDPSRFYEILRSVAAQTLSPEAALDELKASLAAEDLGFATLDHQRALRTGFPEVVFGAGKSAEQIAAIAERIAARGQNVLVTRVEPAVAEALRARFPAAVHHPVARCLTLETRKAPALPGRVAVVCAGTSDVPVAEEAAVTAAFHGATVDRVFDVGVAGLHRLLARAPVLREATVVIVAAGMEGALPSVVGGLVEAPVIAVPTSIGYGASFGGLAALLGMLNSCASGLAVVNIDNGFGAGHLACTILRTASRVKS